MIRRLLFFATIAIGCVPPGSSQVPVASQRESLDNVAVASGSASARPRRLVADYLPNPVRLHPRVISGGVPGCDAAFAELQAWGVETIISVDGARPDVKTAARYGLRYVHLPHGYDGIPDGRIQELAKAVRDLPGSIYIHCHHGKHRSPAAASAACVTAGLISSTDAIGVLALAGTSQNYHGLYQAVCGARPLAAGILNELQVDFRESVPVPPLAEAMVALERIHDRLKAMAAAGWRTPADKPEHDAAHDALLLHEHFTELLRLDEVSRRPRGFRELLRDSADAAGKLTDGLQRWQPASRRAAAPESFAQHAERIGSNCLACHRQYRDCSLAKGTSAREKSRSGNP